jgi:hypothetical protein
MRTFVGSRLKVPHVGLQVEALKVEVQSGRAARAGAEQLHDQLKCLSDANAELAQQVTHPDDTPSDMRWRSSPDINGMVCSNENSQDSNDIPIEYSAY